MRFWLWQSLISIDQLINSVFFAGWSDETISARCYRLRGIKTWNTRMNIINKIFFWQKDHCQESYGSEILRAQMPEEYRA